MLERIPVCKVIATGPRYPPQAFFCPYLGKGHDKSVKLGLLSSWDDLIHGDVPRVIAVLDVLRDAAVEQDGLLGHDANLGAQEGHIDTSRVVAINQLQRAIDFTIGKEQ